MSPRSSSTSQNASPRKPAGTRLASTILLLRDGNPGDPPLEMFMVERHHKIDFAEGALVFPGGKVEENDGAPELARFCRSTDDSSEVDAVRVAAIRETFEECGVLLARPRGGETLIEAPQLEAISARYRDELRNHSIEMLDLVQSEDLELAFDLLVPFAHWITPDFMPKRFDTYFFLVEAPMNQLAVHDGAESVDSLWTTVPRALELERSGQRTIIFPTLENVKKLGRSRTVAEALENARNDTIVTVQPRTIKDPDGTLMMELPEEAGYDTVRVSMEALGGRLPKGAKSA